MTLADSRQNDLPRIQPFADRDEMISALTSFRTLGKEITLIGRSIPIGLGRTIDLLGVDRGGHLVFGVAAHNRGEALLLEALDLAAWLEESKGLLQELLPLSGGDARGARLLLIAAGFSRRVLRLAEFFGRMRIELVQCRQVVVGGETAFLLDNVATGDAALIERADAVPVTNCPSASSGVQLTPLAASGIPLTRQEVEELTRPLKAG